MCRSKRAQATVTLPATSTQRDELAVGGQPRLAAWWRRRKADPLSTGVPGGQLAAVVDNAGGQIRLSAHTSCRLTDAAVEGAGSRSNGGHRA
jgi:hypothetical protein